MEKESDDEATVPLPAPNTKSASPPRISGNSEGVHCTTSKY